VVVDQRRRWLQSHLKRITSIDNKKQEPIENQLVLKYGSHKFHIAKEIYEGSVLVFPSRTYLWPVSDITDISMDNLAPVATQSPSVEILVIGCGEFFFTLPRGLRKSLSDWGVALEWMDTGAAIRTYNVLMAEGRCCAAALIAVE
jgi:uncharacterized protein